MLLSNELQIEYLLLKLIKDYPHQLRIPGKNQIDKAERVIRECHFMLPIPIDKDNCAVFGEHFVAAARRLGMECIPVVRIDYLSEEKVRLLRHALDRITKESTLNLEAIAKDLRDLMVNFPDLDLSLTGYDPGELDIMLDPLSGQEAEDYIPLPETGPSVVKSEDLYWAGDHALYCGDALLPESFQRLMGNEKAQMCTVDAPYNVAITGHAGNSGKKKHREFLQGAGEFTPPVFTDFLYKSHQNLSDFSQDGAVIFSTMDWRHMMEIQTAALRAGLSLLNLCVWCKDNGGMGSLYRSQHELVFVFKNGKAPHINNVQLGKHRYRTNVWQYAGVNSFGGGRMDELALHPTPKPVDMIADAIKDCSKRGGIILDCFGGSGTTMIAAEKTGRKARLIELDPLYCDTTLRRWQALTGKDAVHADTGLTFNEIAAAGGPNE